MGKDMLQSSFRASSLISLRRCLVTRDIGLDIHNIFTDSGCKDKAFLRKTAKKL